MRYQKIKEERIFERKNKRSYQRIKSGREKINLTDKDAKFIKERHEITKPNYNCHILELEDGFTNVR
jgi:hypothetical protein